jgi:hypothetical protein
MSATKQGKTGRLTDANFPIPKAIPKTALQELLEAHGFASAETTALSERLGWLIDEYSSRIKKVRRRRSTSDDKKDLKDSIKKINDAIRHIRNCGPVGRLITQHSLSSLGEMLSVSWLHEKFPNDGDLLTGAVASRGRSRLREQRVYIEEHTSEARYYFAQKQNLPLVGAVLSEINKCLDRAFQKSKGSGGRSRCEFRHYFLINLALTWKQAGRDPHHQEPFLAFCEHVFEYIGWPLAGIKRAIDKALADPAAGGEKYPKGRRPPTVPPTG